MRDSGNANAEAKLTEALGELASANGTALASDRVRQVLRAEVRAHGHRRRAALWMGVAAALALLLVGASLALRSGSSPRQQTQLARTEAVRPESPAGDDAVETQAAAEPVQPRRATRSRAVRQPSALAGEWRPAEAGLTPWYYNTAVPPSARTTLVRFDADPDVASRFGVVGPARKVPAEVLLGEDGLPRAIRFLQRPASRKD